MPEAEQTSQPSEQALEQQKPSEQCPLAHSVAAPQPCPVFFLQSPRESHVLTPLQALSSWFAMTLVHAPDALAHERQGVVQASPQHVPSTQWPLAHSEPRPQDCPFFLPQVPAELHVLVPLQVSSS